MSLLEKMNKAIEEIDFLKIDTEGSELAALRTFDDYVNEGKIRFIQFEYGKPSLFGKSFLNGFFESLNSKYTMHRVFYKRTFCIFLNYRGYFSRTYFVFKT